MQDYWIKSNSNLPLIHTPILFLRVQTSKTISNQSLIQTPTLISTLIQPPELLDVGAPTRALIRPRHQLPLLAPWIGNLPIEAATALPTIFHRAQQQQQECPHHRL